MTLGTFAVAVGATPRWVQNAHAVLGLPARYTDAHARRLGLARVLHECCGAPLVEAYPLAGVALATWPRGRCWQRTSPDGVVTLTIDLERFLSSFAARLSVARTLFAGQRAGRPRRQDLRGIALARHHGVDIGLLESSLRRSPEERLRSLEADVSFLRALRLKQR